MATCNYKPGHGGLSACVLPKGHRGEHRGKLDHAHKNYGKVYTHATWDSSAWNTRIPRKRKKEEKKMGWW